MKYSQSSSTVKFIKTNICIKQVARLQTDNNNETHQGTRREEKKKKKQNLGRLRQVDYLRSGVQDQTDQHGEIVLLLKI